MENKSFKKKVIAQFINDLSDKMDALGLHAKDLSDALNSESKSTAGDKHDTSRAMIHLEQEKIQHQFQVLKNQRNRLKEIENKSLNHDTIHFGSLVKSEQDLFLMGIGLGKQVIGDQIIYCVGMDTPVGKLFSGKKVGDEVFFNGKVTTIKNIS